MDGWTALAVVVAFLVLIAFGPPALVRNWSWPEKLEALRRRLAK